ncbi:aspartate carbamoyltransferase catalytic subunit [Halobacillus sp. Cin3]|uniref:aspartate carbamoyltransferase catalytic subunit n=1 Tax=Halobacillus sp. Cin3 TaxID=2928441 RepID=UPI00248ECB98|nr:aspartate carbamoyltransferase catalytic subunit [Halobacillus sp. Cin3]
MPVVQPLQHLLSMKELSPAQIFQLIERAERLNQPGDNPSYHGRFAANLFLEPSTRTKVSFQIAQRKSGFELIDLEGRGSSLTKGESLYDTLKTLESLGVELAVVRQSQTGLLQHCASHLNLTLINAGDGCGEHPTQSLLDLYTIYEQFHRFKGLRICIAGDIKHSRVARSNAAALSRLGAEVYFVSKPEWQDSAIADHYISMDEAVTHCDVLMLLRIQHERHIHREDTAAYLEQYGLTKEREARMDADSIILHPAPVNRGVEIDSDLVESRKSRIFRQMSNGVAVRMAVMDSLMKGEL